jgi:hypothetical protein
MFDEGSKLTPELKALLRREWLGQLRDRGVLDTFELELELFGWYLRETDELIVQMEVEEVACIREQLDAGDPEPNDSGIVAASYYARRVRYSHVIYLASLLESVMKRECRRLFVALGKPNVPFLWSDLKGDPWSAKRQFLEKYGHFEIEPMLWRPLQHLLNVRNVLVHDNGTVDSLSLDRRAAITKASGIDIISDELEIKAEYIQSAFEAVQKIARFLNENVRVVIDRAIQPRAAK